MTTGNRIIDFLFNLKFDVQLPAGFDVMHPFKNDETRNVCSDFYNKYYGDDLNRYCIIGINPGRFGAGITGIPFTDPIRLEKVLEIENLWAKKQELSSVFIYEMINAYGGAEKFYKDFYFTAVSPLGLVKEGKNINYYDDKILQESIKPFAVECIQKQLPWLHTSVAFCLGEGKNFAYLSKLNDEYRFFNEIIPLPHPRFIMQYKLKRKEDFISRYVDAFHSASF